MNIYVADFKQSSNIYNYRACLWNWGWKPYYDIPDGASVLTVNDQLLPRDVGLSTITVFDNDGDEEYTITVTTEVSMRDPDRYCLKTANNIRSNSTLYIYVSSGGSWMPFPVQLYKNSDGLLYTTNVVSTATPYRIEIDNLIGPYYMLLFQNKYLDKYGLAWWTDLPVGAKIKTGDILQVYVNIEANPTYQIDTTKFTKIDGNKYVGYLIARSDYTVLGTQADENYIKIPINSIQSSNRQVFYFIDVLGPNGYAQDTDNIWETCTPNDAYASKLPWTFEIKGVISDYISLQWRDAYNEAGTFSLSLPMTDENLDLFKTDRYIFIEKSKKVMIIEEIKINANLVSDGYLMQVSGRSLESILDRRVAFPGMGLNTLEYKGDGGLIKALYDVFDAYFVDPGKTAQISDDGIRYFYYPDRKIEFFEQNGISANTPGLLKRAFNSGINKSIVKDNIYDVISETCQKNELGFRIVPFCRFGDSQCINWKFEIYNGYDKSYYRTNKNDPLLIFSPTFNNVKSISTTKNSTNYKTVVFCGVEKDSEAYIDLCPTNRTDMSVTGLLNSVGIQVPNAISSLKNQISNKLQDNPVTYTGILILALAGIQSDKSYSKTIKEVRFSLNSTYSRTYWSSLGITLSGSAETGVEVYYVSGYPKKPISKDAAATIKVTFYQKFGQDTSTSKTGIFYIDEVSELTGSHNEVDRVAFKPSTSYGWLTSNVVKEGTQAANTMEVATSWTDISGYSGTITRTSILIWFRTFDAYTGDKTMMKWLCQEYVRNNIETGIYRREVFVEQEDNNNDEWDASAIAAARQSTTILKVNSYDDEESDEEVNARLMESARKQSSQFNKDTNIDVDVETIDITYMVDYDLGDIVQVDDGVGDIEEYMITGVIITDDTSDGERIIPEFTKYEVVPSGYKRLEFLSVANMFLPVIFDPRENVANSDTSLNYNELEPSFGPDPKYYDGYIDEIFWERRSKVTEIEMDGGYIRWTDKNGQPNNYKPNFAMLSAVGFKIYENIPYNNSGSYGTIYKVCSRSLTPFLLLNSETYVPLRIGAGLYIPGYDAEGGYTPPYIQNTRRIYQFIGDSYYVDFPSNEYNYYYNIIYYPGLSINFALNYNTTLSYIGDSTASSIDALYHTIIDEEIQTQYGYTSLDYHSYSLNKIVNETCDIHNSNEMPYSISSYDEESIAKRPQHQYFYIYDNNNSEFYQCWEYEYGRTVSSNNKIIPWNDQTSQNTRLSSMIGPAPIGYLTCTISPQTGKPVVSDPVSITDYGYEEPDSGANTKVTFVPWGTVGSVTAPQEGAYGQVSFDHLIIDNIDKSWKNGEFLKVENNSDYRYLVIGGIARVEKYTYNGNLYLDLVFDSGDYGGGDDPVNVELGDIQNGMTIRSLKIYEYDSSYRDIRWSDNKRSNHSEQTSTPVVLFESEGNITTFKNIETASENPSIESRRLVHHYVPVELVDTGDTKPTDVEKYGFYDIIEQQFVPINNNPLNQWFSGDNNFAKFIRAGGELARE